MTPEFIARLRRSLESKGIETVEGLDDDELRDIEEAYGFAFPPDLRALLGAFVPLGDDFPDWHLPRTQDMIEWFDFPADGIAFDVEENGFWQKAWGEKPDDLDDAVEEALTHVARAPVLIPLFSHRFLPAEPAEAGNPVLSVVQTDVVVFSSDLGWYFHDEFGTEEPSWPRPVAKSIRFWSELQNHRRGEGSRPGTFPE